MDEINRKIIQILQEDARASYTDIADELGVSEGTVRNRIERMQEDGTIERFTIEVGGEQRIEAFVMVQVETGADISDIIADFPDDIDAYELAGDQDIIVHATRSSSEEINDTVVDAIRSVDGVRSTKTYMVLGKPR